MNISGGGAVSATDSTKMPLAGGTFTGSVVMAGCQFTGSGVGRVLGQTGAAAFDFGGSPGTVNTSHIPLQFPSAARVAVSNGQIHSNNTAGQIGLDAATGSDAFLAVNGGKVLSGGASALTAYVDLVTPAAGFAHRSPGVAFTNDGAWTNLYSLAAGTHNGRFLLTCALFGGWAIFTVNGTSIALVTDEWGGFADVTAASGKIAFRISGGYLQYNCGTGISSTPKYMHVDFIGIVR